MKPDVASPSTTLRYGYSHDASSRALPWPLFGVLLGTFILCGIDGAEIEPKHFWLGVIVIVLSLGIFAAIVRRRMQPDVASIVLSTDGIVFKDVSDKLIPWREIRSVAKGHTKGARDFLATRVVKISIAEAFFKSLGARDTWSSELVRQGTPTEIYFGYYHKLPVDELYDAMLLRWKAFSGRYDGPPVERDDYTAPTTGAVRFRGRSVAERERPFAIVNALGGLVSGAPWPHRLVSAGFIVAIAALGANAMGLWSTDMQVKRRAETAKWKDWLAQQEAEQRAFDADQKRTREKFDRMFKCMNQTFERHSLGGGVDPECAKDRN